MTENWLVREDEDLGVRLYVQPDEGPADDPREWNPLGTMTCFHRRYNLGDPHDLKPEYFSGWDEVEEHLKSEEGAWVILPLWLLDHSGLRMGIGRRGPCSWDSGQVGFIWCTRREAEKKLKEGVSREKVIEVLEKEVEVYDQWLSGDVWGFRVEIDDPRNGDLGDSCWGYFGKEVCEEEGSRVFEDVVEHLRERRKLLTTGGGER